MSTKIKKMTKAFFYSKYNFSAFFYSACFNPYISWQNGQIIFPGKTDKKFVQMNFFCDIKNLT